MVIKQFEGSGMCVACVAAMVTSTTLDDVYAFLNDGRSKESGDPMTMLELMLYALKCGKSIGYAWAVQSNQDGAKVLTNPESSFMVDDNPDNVFQFRLTNREAVLDVWSPTYKGLTHMVYWDGKRIHDPSPHAKDEPSFDDYIVVNVWPVIPLVNKDNEEDMMFCSRVSYAPSTEVPPITKKYREVGVEGLQVIAMKQIGIWETTK